MNLASLPLWAESVTRTTFEWGRIQSNIDWLPPLGVLLLVLVYVCYMYRRDAVELSPLVGALLTVLRAAAFAALLIFYLQPQWREEEEQTRNSRAVVMIDTSLSMGLADADDAGGSGNNASRIQQVAAALRQSDFIQRLRKTHDVAVMRFDEELHREPVLLLSKLPAKPAEGGGGNAQAMADEPDEKPAELNPAEFDWAKGLALSGDETRLGQSVRRLIENEANAPLAGVIVVSDGGQNAGPGPEAIAAAAKENRVPVFTIGVGSDKLPSNVKAVAFNPPPRAYPGDPYEVKGAVQSWRMAGQQVTVQLLSRPAAAGASNPADRGTGDVLESQEVTLGADGEQVPVKFQVTPDEVGRRTMSLKIIAPQNDRDRDDNLLEADLEVVDRKNKVLLFAGGPMREYQFVRNQLYRDKSTVSDVLLQSGKAGISQEGNKILDDFPADREEMFAYDCMIAFDPDWQALDPAQVDLLEEWVFKQGGGLIVIAGPVFTGKQPNGWVQDPAMKKVRDLYPVEFPRKLSPIDSGTYESKDPWPLDFSREGLEAHFIAVCDSAVESRQAWEAFAGVYGYFPVRGAKQGATVLARFADPRTRQNDQQPVFMAWQIYGSGKVFYLGSAELWRIRSQDINYFEQFYTKVIRHISSGRLNRGSTRGVLLVGQERYRLGNAVTVTAYQMTNAQLATLEVPSLALQVYRPDQTVQPVTLRPDPGRPGSYVGQFTVLQEGDYRLELPVPESNEERLTQRIRVEIPNLERERPQRNDAVLGEIARKTGDGQQSAKYFVGLGAILDSQSGLVEMLKDRTRTITLTATPSRDRQERWLLWLMLGLFGFLCLEWTIRRLCKLA